MAIFFSYVPFYLKDLSRMMAPDNQVLVLPLVLLFIISLCTSFHCNSFFFALTVSLACTYAVSALAFSMLNM